MNEFLERILVVAQRLDELADEMPELASLSEGLGLAVENLDLDSPIPYILVSTNNTTTTNFQVGAPRG